MKELLVIGMGGFIGAIARFLLGGWVQKFSAVLIHPSANQFPLGTLIVNVVGCFLFGFLSSRVSSPQMNSMVFVGFLGAFTTFSTFSHDTIHLLDKGNHLIGWIYLVVSLAAGIGFLLIGRTLGTRI